jgi:CRISPR-associated helicase Cas3
MLNDSNHGAEFDVADNTRGMRFLRKGKRILDLASELITTNEDEFDDFLKEKKLFASLSVRAGYDTELIYIQPTPPPKTSSVDTYLDQHLAEVEQNARKLAAALDVPPDVTEPIARAAVLHDTGKAHPAWQGAFGNSNGGRHIAKLKSGKRVIKQHILNGLRHEFVSLAEAISAEDALTLQVIASHHKWGRPHFPSRGYDRRKSVEENRQANLANIRRFIALQKNFGIWGLAYLEALLRAADAMAEG